MNSILMKLSGPNFAPIEFEVLSLSHGVSMPMEAATDRSGITPVGSVFQDMTVCKNADLFSPRLNFLCSNGQVIEQLELRYNFTHEKQDGENNDCCYEYLLKDCMITSVSVGGGGYCPVETLTFCFKSIAWKFTSPEDETSAEWIIKTF